MPPKKNSKASSAATPTRSSRSQTKAGVATIETTATVDSKKASTVGKRKRTVAEVVPPPSDSDSEEALEVRARAKTGPKKKAAASPTKKARTTTSKKKANTPFSLKTCEGWFESLEDPQSTGNITYNTIPAWLNELGVSTEGIIFYIIAWICKAKQTFIISKEEFLYGMGLLSADSNEALIRKLPPILKEVYPSHSNKSFNTFYMFCFNYFKPTDVKNLAIEVAQELFTSLLDINRYSLSWIPEENAPECEEKETDFPHRKSFVEFLNQSPLQVITRDQYEQFLPFNKHMPWDFAGFNEEESTWPTLMDNYIVWRKEKYPLVGAEKVEA